MREEVRGKDNRGILKTIRKEVKRDWEKMELRRERGVRWGELYEGGMKG